MRFEIKKGSKEKGKKKKKHFVNQKAYFSSCYSFITPFPLNVKDDF
jgi:hypothetical protein